MAESFYTMKLQVRYDPDDYNKVTGMVGENEDGSLHVCVGPDLQGDQIRIGQVTSTEAWEAIESYHREQKALKALRGKVVRFRDPRNRSTINAIRTIRHYLGLHLREAKDMFDRSRLETIEVKELSPGDAQAFFNEMKDFFSHIEIGDAR